MIQFQPMKLIQFSIQFVIWQGLQKKIKKTTFYKIAFLVVVSGRLDSNQRPHAPQTCALPGCATSRTLKTNLANTFAHQSAGSVKNFLLFEARKST